MISKYRNVTLLCVWALLVLVITAPTDVSAQDSLPPGSYRDSCRNVQSNGVLLTATCESRSGAWTTTNLSTNFCLSEITNNDGALDCTMESFGPTPVGTFVDSCVQLSVYEGTLNALCRTETGEWRRDGLDTRDCRTPIENIFGHLSCDKGDAPAPPGTYRMSCANPYMRNGTLNAVCQTRSRSWQETELKKVSRCNSGYGIWNDNGVLKCNKKSTPPPASTGVWWTVQCKCSKTFEVTNFAVDMCGYTGGGPAIPLFACNYVKQMMGYPDEPGCIASSHARSQNTNACTEPSYGQIFP